MILGPSGNSGLKSLAGKIDPKKAGEILLGILGAIDKGIDDADELFNPGSGPDLPKPLGPDDIPEIPDGMVNQVKVKI